MTAMPGQDTAALPAGILLLHTTTALLCCTSSFLTSCLLPCGPCRCRESDRSGAGSYHDLMRIRFGKWGGRAVAVAQVGCSPPPSLGGSVHRQGCTQKPVAQHSGSLLSKLILLCLLSAQHAQQVTLVGASFVSEGWVPGW